jgi:hypothetical protein
LVPRGIPDVLMVPQIGSSDVAEELSEDLKNRREEAKDSIAVAQRYQRLQAAGKDRIFEVGDLVLIRYSRMGPGYRPPKDHRHKLAPLHTPVRVVERLSPVSYRVDLPKGSRIHDVVSVTHLKRYNGEGEDVRPLPIVTEEESEIYEVEKVMGERIKRGKTEFLVKWKGYPDEEMTWEESGNMDGAKDAVMDWRATKVDRKKATRKDKTTSSEKETDLAVAKQTTRTRRSSRRSPQMLHTRSSTCRECRSFFHSRNRLFAHVRSTGHER